MAILEFAAQNSANTTVTTTTETVAVTMPAISTRSPDERVRLMGALVMTYGTATTAVTVRVRRGTDATGTLVGEANALSVAAGNTSEQTWDVLDTPGDVAGQTYVVTVQQTAATGNGTVLFAEGAVTVGV